VNKRRSAVVTVIGLTAVFGAAAATNLIVEHKVRQRAVETARCHLDATKITAELGDPLAGLRALTGSVGAVHITAEGVRRQGTELTVDAHLHDVSTSGHMSGGTATATAAYDELGASIPGAVSGMKAGTDGTHLTLTGSAGGGIPVTVVTDLSTTSGSLTITPASVSVLGQRMPVEELSSLPGASRFADDLSPRTITIDKLSDGAELTGAHAGSDGLVLEFRLSPESIKKPGKANSACASGSPQAVG
jgi:hypothetical protein